MDARPDDHAAPKVYSDVPPALVARLQQFRARYPGRRAIVAGTDWHYIDTATGEDSLLVLTGAACVAEMSWLSIDHFAQRHRVIAPDYPALDTMAGLVDGIAALLDQQAIRRPHVMGGSYGGLVAQVFVRRHPDRTASLILSHTVLPQRATAARMARLVSWMRWLPMPALRALFRVQLGRLFPKGQHPEVALSKALFSEIVDYRLTKGQIISLMRRVADLGVHYSFTANDLGTWPGRILLLTADDDPATPQPVREALGAIYPRAEIHTFSGAGHLTAVLQQDEYFAVIDEFLKTHGTPESH